MQPAPPGQARTPATTAHSWPGHLDPFRVEARRWRRHDDGMTDYADVRRAYDIVASDYAARLPDTRAEAPLDLAMVDAFVAVITEGG